MAYARVSYTGDGTTSLYSVPFPYISQDYVEVRVAGVLLSLTIDYSWLTDSTIQFVTPPASGVQILLNRNTPKDSRLVNYQDGNILKEETLDLDSDQAFHVIQEALDAVSNVREVETFVGGVDYTGGTTTSLVLAGGEVLESSILILFDGVAQQVTEYSVSSGVITFDSAIPSGVLKVQVSFALGLTGGLPDGSVSTSKIVDGNVAAIKLATDSVPTEKVVDGAITATKLDPEVFHDLTEVVPTTSDYSPIADASDSNKKKKSVISAVLSLIASATTSVRGLIQLAVSSEVGGDNATKAITSATMAYHWGITKVWVTFNGSTGAMLGAANVTSVARNGTGDYTINFSYPFFSPNYCILGTAEDDNATGSTIVTRYSTDARTTSTCRIRTIHDAGGAVDSSYVSVAFLGYLP